MCFQDGRHRENWCTLSSDEYSPIRCSTDTEQNKPASGAPPESPTTARPLDFDDDPQETPLSASTNNNAAAAAPKSSEDAPPPKPPRPLSPREQAETTLREAFPSIDAGVIRAVLAASGGQVEPAFNALLGSSRPCLAVLTFY